MNLRALVSLYHHFSLSLQESASRAQVQCTCSEKASSEEQRASKAEYQKHERNCMFYLFGLSWTEEGKRKWERIRSVSTTLEAVEENEENYQRRKRFRTFGVEES